MKFRKIIIVGLITIILAGIFFGPFGANIIAAQKNPGGFYSGTPEGGWEGGSLSISCGIFDYVCYIAVIVQSVIWTPASWIMIIGGKVLNLGIQLSISDPLFKNLAISPAVTSGWAFSRDIVNLFLIFILLYIAIATILRVSGYGAKELLTTLIIVAFLVNFSGVITKMIIDASNILAMAFYNKFTTSGGNINISKTFINAFDGEKMLNADKSLREFAEKGNYMIILLTFLFSSVIMVIAGFIFFAFGVLFFIRMVILLLLIVFAPLAFGAMVLPSTKTHAKKWWDSLFNQAFFAPAALFVLLLAAKMSQFVNTSLKDKITSVGMADMTNATANWRENPKTMNDTHMFIVQFAIIAITLIASLIVSKQMGAMGASTAIAAGKTARRKVQGYAGTIGRRYTAPVAEKLATSEGGFARTLRKIPLATRGLAAASVLNQKEVGKWEKLYGSYSEKTFSNLIASPGGVSRLNPSQRKAIEKIQLRNTRKKKEDKVLFGKGQYAQKLSIMKQRQETQRAAEEAEEMEKQTKITSEKEKKENIYI